MTAAIAEAAGEWWLAIDKREGGFQEIIMKEMEAKGHSKELLWMALGWLVYEGYVKWTPGERGGRLFVMSRRKEACHEESDQNRFAAHGA